MDKQQILNEIKRTAEENGGVPLGIGTFQKATGIRREDWLGKFWVRWSDAVNEAGLQPNTLQGRLDDDVVIEKLIGLIRELRHFPVKAELQKKAYEDKTFPTYMTFRKRGTKQQLIARILTYCGVRKNYEDVVSICSAVEEPTHRKVEGSDKAEINLGFVYLLKSGRYYKIGRSVSVGQRERQLAIQLPDKTNTVHSIRTDDPVGIEAYWHNRFAQKRKNGEWFDLSSQEISAFKRRKFM